ncbi:MAG: hypothetical protein ACTHJQ_22595 [Rhizobiaceae bacterium]
MDPVPTGAALLLAFIRSTETGRADRSAYNTIYAHKESKLPKVLSTMTLGDIIDAQKAWSKNFGSSAAGAYQFMRATLIDLSKAMNLSGSLIFDASLQDELGYELLKRRGYADYMAGKIDRTEFGKRLSMEWASFPVLAPCQGAHRTVQRGETYYAGDKLNKALVSPERVEQVLITVRKAPDTAAPSLADAQKTAGYAPQSTAPKPSNPKASSAETGDLGTTPKTGVGPAVTLVVVGTAGFWAWFSGFFHHIWSLIP